MALLSLSLASASALEASESASLQIPNVAPFVGSRNDCRGGALASGAAELSVARSLAAGARVWVAGLVRGSGKTVTVMAGGGGGSGGRDGMSGGVVVASSVGVNADVASKSGMGSKAEALSSSPPHAGEAGLVVGSGPGRSWAAARPTSVMRRNERYWDASIPVYKMRGE